MLDTVGFITDLPHGLVESFKATLEEIHFADVIVHVRDISHPHTEHQRETVLRVLSEIGIAEDHLKDRYLEVWNKIDLVEDREALVVEDNDYPVIMMSCKTGENRNEFLDLVADLSTDRMGKKMYRIEYPGVEHNRRISWLNKHASITQDCEFEYNGDMITISVLIDDVTYKRFLKEFERESFMQEQNKKKVVKGMPPPGWGR